MVCHKLILGILNFTHPYSCIVCAALLVLAKSIRVVIYCWLTDKTFRLAVETAATRTKSAYAD
jgi:hypothetical protein